ncbi:MAG TPA: hypothetical protein VF727_01535 [Allosphingosinicella sp.]|jgi:hypothetical protein
MAAYRAIGDHDGRLPDRYRRPPYILTRMAIPFVCGTVPWAFEATSLLMSFYLGASAPLVIDKLAQGTLPKLPGSSPS